MRANRSRPSFGSGYYTIKVRFVQTRSQVPVTSKVTGTCAQGITSKNGNGSHRHPARRSRALGAQRPTSRAAAMEPAASKSLWRTTSARMKPRCMSV